MDVVLSLVEGDVINSVAISQELKPGQTEPTPTPTESPRLEWDEPDQVVDADQFTYAATIVTEKGTIEIDLFADEAPNTVNSFVFLAQQGFFDNVVFHRIVDDFVAQAGDPTGQQGDGYDGSRLHGRRGREHAAERPRAALNGEAGRCHGLRQSVVHQLG